MFVMLDKLMTSPKTLAKRFVGSLVMGAGQFCTNPGWVVRLKGDTAETFKTTVRTEAKVVGIQIMLTPDILSRRGG